MAKTLIVKPLGLVIQAAGLVTPQQVQLALEDRQILTNLKIGQIMAMRGWINQQTADFFAEQWSQLLNSLPKEPIGQYFKAAGLIDESQIQMILQEQASCGLKFGALAVIKGIISQKTLDFFLEQLSLSSTIGNVPQKILETIEVPNRVENYLIRNRNCEPTLLLNLYRQIRQQQEVMATGSQAEKELIQSGLVVEDNCKLKIEPSCDRTYDESWIQQQLVRLQPYSKIRVRLFGLEATASNPYRVLAEVNSWTGEQPFLTQKIYQILRDRHFYILRNQESTKISELVDEYIISDWENKLAASHLSKLRDRLLNPPTGVDCCLLNYQKIWHGKSIAFDGTPQQQYLLKIGLIKLEQDKVKVANRIYHNIFDRNWLEKRATDNLDCFSKKNNCSSDPKPHKSSVKNNSSGIIKIVSLLVCIGGLTWFGWSAIAFSQQTRQLRRANRLLAQQKYADAITAYDRLLGTNISKPYLIWVNRGTAFGGLNRYQEMLQSCSNATLIRPQAAIGWNCQGEALYFLEQYSNALEAFDNATQLNPPEATFWLNKARVLSDVRRYPEAIESIERAIESIQQTRGKNHQQKLAIAFEQQGQLLLKTDGDRQALEAFEQSLDNAPNYLPPQLGKGVTLYRLGNYQQAIATFEQILQRDDLTPEQEAISWLYIGVSLCQTRQSTAAKSAFERVLQLPADSQSRTIARKGCGI